MAEEEQQDQEDIEEVEGEEVEDEEEEGSVKKKASSTSEEGQQSNSSQKLVSLVLVLNIIVLGVIAAFVWMNLSKSKQAVSLADVEAAKNATEAEGAEDEIVESKFVKESFTVNLADSSGSHFAKVDVEIEVADDFVREELVRLKPRIRDFIVVVLSSKTYDQIASVDGRDFLREEIRNKINGYLTKGQVKNVYFTQFIIQ